MFGEWQPIETAPIGNGSNRFLAYIPGHGVSVCWKSNTENLIFSVSGRRIYKATHWIPLPPPPSDGD